MEKMVKWEALQDNQKVTGLICGLDIMWQSDLILSLFQHAGVSFITTFTLPSVSFPLSQKHVTIVFSFCAWMIETFHSFRGISWNTSWMVLEKKKNVVVYQNLLELLLLTLIRFLPPSLPGVLGKHTSSTLTLDETVQHQSTDSWSKVKPGYLSAFVLSVFLSVHWQITSYKIWQLISVYK